jgi:hypothetical protein
MKRLTTLLMAGVLTLAMVACGGKGGAQKSDSPSDVVKKAMTCAVNEDYEGMVQYLEGTEGATDEELKDAGAMLALIYSLGSGVKEFEIRGEEIDDNGLEAEVRLSITDKKGVVREDEADLVKTDAGWRIRFD